MFKETTFESEQQQSRNSPEVGNTYQMAYSTIGEDQNNSSGKNSFLRKK